MRFRAAVALVLAVPALTSPAAFAGPRESPNSYMQYTTTQPGAPTGTDLHVWFVNPTDPNAKPYAVQNMIVHTPTGGVVDTTALPQCHATDAEIYLEGFDACPADTLLGGGFAVSDSGPNSPSRYSRTTIQNYNNQDEVVGIGINDDIPAIRNIDRSKYDYQANTLTSTFPLFPAVPEPPTNEPYMPISELAISFPAHASGAKTYARTPPTCPPSRHWTFVVDFVYRDGTTDTITSESPCDGPAATATVQPSSAP